MFKTHRHWLVMLIVLALAGQGWADVSGHCNGSMGAGYPGAASSMEMDTAGGEHRMLSPGAEESTHYHGQHPPQGNQGDHAEHSECCAAAADCPMNSCAGSGIAVNAILPQVARTGVPVIVFTAGQPPEPAPASPFRPPARQA